jgi:excisionase family DNA binding protein
MSTRDSRTSRQRESVKRKERLRKRREEREQALKHPDAASIKPVCVTVREFAAVTGLSTATIYRRLAKGQIKSVKLHGKRLISFSEVEAIYAGKQRGTDHIPFCSEACEAASDCGETAWRMRCLDCKRDVSKAGHYYMVSDALWAESGLAKDGGQLCLDCLEARIGRPLADSDFTTKRPRAWRSVSGRWHDLTEL